MALDDKFRQRVAEVMTEELKTPERSFWLSFVGEKGFLGVIICRAHGISDALMKCNLLGINPGGEVASHELPDSPALRALKDEDYWRLIQKDEIAERWGIMTQKELEELEAEEND